MPWSTITEQQYQKLTRVRYHKYGEHISLHTLKESIVEASYSVNYKSHPESAFVLGARREGEAVFSQP